jgi:hypothetical protein
MHVLSKRFNLLQTAYKHRFFQVRRILTVNLRLDTCLRGLAFQFSFEALFLTTHN